MLPASYREGLVQLQQQLSSLRRVVQVYGEARRAVVCFADAEVMLASSERSLATSSLLLAGSATSVGVLSALAPSASASVSSAGCVVPRNFALFLQAELAKAVSGVMSCIDDRLRAATTAAALSAMLQQIAKQSKSSPAFQLADWSDAQRRTLEARRQVRRINRINRCVLDLARLLRSSPMCTFGLDAPELPHAPFGGRAIRECSAAGAMHLALMSAAEDFGTTASAAGAAWLSKSPQEVAAQFVMMRSSTGKKDKSAMNASPFFTATDIVDWLDEFIEAVLD
jgi:hypothetical protein